MAFTVNQIKFSLAFTLVLLSGFFIFTAYTVLFDNSLHVGFTAPPRSAFSGFAVLLEDKATRDSMVIWFTVALMFSCISLVLYWKRKSVQIEDNYY